MAGSQEQPPLAPASAGEAGYRRRGGEITDDEDITNTIEAASCTAGEESGGESATAPASKGNATGRQGGGDGGMRGRTGKASSGGARSGRGTGGKRAWGKKRKSSGIEERGAGEGVSESGSDTMEEEKSGDDEVEKAVPPVKAAKGVKRPVRARMMERVPRAMLKNGMFWWHVFGHNRSVTSAAYHPRVAARKAAVFFFGGGC